MGQTDQATLETVRPDVQWSPAGTAGWQSVPDRQPVRASDCVRAGPGASARLVYLEGSVTEIGPATGLLVQRLETGPRGHLLTTLFQSVGNTVGRIGQAGASAACIQIETPAPTALVRGTAERVTVADDGTTRVANLSDGTGSMVILQGKHPDRSEVQLPPGFESGVRPGFPPPAPRPVGALAAD